MKRKNLWKKGISLLLTGAMILSGTGIQGVNHAKAEETSDEYTTSYMDIGDYMDEKILCPSYYSGDTYGLDGNGTVAKVYLGRDKDDRPIEWYIAGHDESGQKKNANQPGILAGDTSNLVLLSTKSFGASQYQERWADGYKYNDSALMKTLASYCYGGKNARFSKIEDSLLDEWVIGSGDSGTDGNEVKLYAPNVSESSSGIINHSEIVVGASDDLKVSSDYFKKAAGSGDFRLRTAMHASMSEVMGYDSAKDETKVAMTAVTSSYQVVPAATLSLAETSHMSILPAMTEGAYSDGEGTGKKFGDTMTIRLQGEDEIASRAFCMKDSIKVVKSEQDDDLYLCVQGVNRKSSDRSITLRFGYSMKIDKSQTIDMQTIKEAVGSKVDLSPRNCQVWLEKPTDDDSMVYAVKGIKADADKEITSVDMTCNLPVKGENFSDYKFTYERAKFTTAGINDYSDKYPLYVKYYLGDEEAKGEIKAGNTYTSQITVEPRSSSYYFFSMDITAKDVTVNGMPATSVTRNSNGTLTITYDTIIPIDLKSVAAVSPGAISHVANGTPKTAEALGLPKTVLITTDDDTEMDADVVWDLEQLAEGTYDPAVKTEQKFKVNGKVELPAIVENPDDISLDVTVDVTVDAKEHVTVSNVAITDLSEPKAGVALATKAGITEGVKASQIEYTVKGSDTPVSGEAGYHKVYTAKITLSTEEYYTFAEDLAKEKITVNGNPIASFSKNEDGSITVTYEFAATKKAKLISITAPEDITVPNGAAKSVEGLLLPSAVTIKTEDAAVTGAAITWNLNRLSSGSYNPAKKTEQKFVVEGKVTLPESVSNDDNVFLTVKASVTVSAKGADDQENGQKKKIAAVEITGVTAPEAGKSFVREATCATAGVVSAAAVKFINKSTNNVAVTKAKYNTVYIAKITLTAEEGYEFASDIKAENVSVNGDQAVKVVVNSNGTLTVTYEFAPTQKAKLLGIKQPDNISNVANGTAKTAEALGLPDTVTIETEDDGITSASVIWDLDKLADGTYDAAVKTAQSFTVNGTVILPETVRNADNIALTVTVKVSVAAGKDSNNNNNNNNNSNNNNNKNNSSNNTNTSTSNNSNTGNKNNIGTNAGNTNAGTDAETPKDGTKVTDKKTKSVYVFKNGAVVYTGTTDAKAKTVTVKASVTVDGVTYKVTSIADGAFRKMKNLTKVTIGANIKTIGKNAFSGCAKLTTVTVGKNVTSIGNKAFYNCTALKSVIIPSKVTKIGKSAFEKCKNLSTITIKTRKLKQSSVGANALKGTAKNATVKVPAKSLKAYSQFLYKKGLSKKAEIE